MVRSRQDLLRDLVELRGDLAQTMSALAEYGWDSEEELLVVRREQVVAVLERFLAGGTSAREVERWAEAVECRDDLSFAEGVSEVISELANPALHDVITEERAREILARFAS